MKKKIDVGLEHIIKLDIHAVHEPNGLYNAFCKKYNQTKAREICKNLYGSAEHVGMQKFYENKNADYDVAMIFSGCYDADIVRKACNWINDNQDVFGDEILEIGCDCGFMTTFLGSLFPDKHILAIDRNQSGIDIAKKNAEKFGLTNIDFMCVDAIDLEDKSFDTVFSMRTMHENGDFNKEDFSNELMVQADIFTNEIQSYADALSSLLKDNGYLVSIERLNRNALFLAWIQSLTNSGLKIHLDSFIELQCLELGDPSTFEALVFSKEDTSDVDTFMSFICCVADCMDITLPKYTGWDAKIMYELTGGPLIAGVEALDTITGTKNRIACRVHKNDETCLLWYQNNDGDVFLEYHDISEKENCKEAINNAIKEASEYDYLRITKLEH